MLIVGADGARLVDEGRGPPLGISASARYGQAETTLGADERLVVYSGGLVELRTEDLQDRVERLRDVVADGSRDVEELLDGALAPSRRPTPTT